MLQNVRLSQGLIWGLAYCEIYLDYLGMGN